ncbi:integral membrane protein [Xylariomycetidae sp. FL2044]|nr:integral membrane protein [Xylariomycetidae sp. FL2044]
MGNLGYDVNPPGTRLFITQMLFLVFAWITGIIRAYVKTLILKKQTLDDWLMYMALVLYTVFSYFVMVGVTEGGNGKHTTQLKLGGVQVALRCWYIGEVIFPLISCFIRISIALSFLRIAVIKWHRRVIYAVMVVTLVMSLVFFFATVFQCSPPSYYWKQIEGVKWGSCINPAIVPNVAIVHGVITAICDWVLGLLPIPMLWHVQINRRTKAGIAVLLSMGMLAGIALIIRIPYIRILAVSPDFLYETINVAIWSAIEPGLGIMAGCIANMRPLFKKFGVGFRISKRSRSGSSGWRSGRGRQELSGDEPLSANTSGSRFVGRSRKAPRLQQNDAVELAGPASARSSATQAGEPATQHHDGNAHSHSQNYCDLGGVHRQDLKHWDVEGGLQNGLTLPPPAAASIRAIEVHTSSFDVTSHHQ